VNSDILDFIKEKDWARVKKIIHDATDEDIEVGDGWTSYHLKLPLLFTSSALSGIRSLCI